MIAAADIVRENVRTALAEDVGTGDLTAKLIPAETSGRAVVVCRDPAVLCGRPWFNEVFRQLDPSIRIDWRFEDGEVVDADAVICELGGNSRALLTGERTALNFLQTLSATASSARVYADAVAGSGAKILDTRKTIPGLRHAQKYAVSCGGCHNHRMGLYDKILIKENHIAAAGSISAALKQAFALVESEVDVEIEVETLDQLTEALNSGARHVMLDNFPLGDITTAVQMNRRRAIIEVSGGVELETIRDIAATGVDYISIGSLTKHIRAIDFSMRVDD